MSRSRSGIALAVGTAIISGFAVFVNSYGVAAWRSTADATTYTTAKNAVAAIVLLVVLAAARRAGVGDARPARVRGATRWWLGVIAIVGGSIPFVLFFEGLALASSGQAAFIHKTLVVWVALAAPFLLKERLRWWHGLAVGLLIAGQFVLVGGIGDVVVGRGELLIALATLLWSAEVLIAKRVLGSVPSLTVGVTRMAGGAVLLVGYGLVRGSLGSLATVTLEQWGWVLLTGAVLAGYVGTWFAALSRAPAVDVTAVLVGGAVITALLRTGIGDVPLPDVRGLGLVAAGAVLAWAGSRRSSIPHDA